MIAAALAFNGAGQWSLDHAIGWDVAGLWWGLGALAVAVFGAVTVIAAARHSERVHDHSIPSTS